MSSSSSSSSAAPAAELEDSFNLDELLSQWRREQDKVASCVIVLDDENDPSSVNGTAADSLLGPDGRYRLVAPSARSDDDDDGDTLYGGVDVSFPESGTDDPAVAVYVILRVAGAKDREGGGELQQEVVYEDHEYFRPAVPYVSSYLSFREIDPLARLVRKQMTDEPELTPRAILVDGNGVLHVRRAGLACFLGVRTGVPTIGVGKKLYCHQSGGWTHGSVERGIEERLRSFCDWLKKDDYPPQPQDGVGRMKIMAGGLVIDRECIGAIGTAEAESTALASSASASSSTAIPADGGNLLLPPTLAELVEIASSAGCNGFATYLRGTDGETVWGAALLCHGGRAGAGGEGGRSWRRGGSRPTVGTKKPIYVSVGHGVSLREAARVCSEVSLARVPEPVRQADLRGRRLMRERADARRTGDPEP